MRNRNVVIVKGLFFGGEIEPGTFHLLCISNVQNASSLDNTEQGDNEDEADMDNGESDSPDDSDESYEEAMYP